MTTQSGDIITYRGKEYILQGLPLESFLEGKKDVVFEMYTTSNWRGYEAHWILENNKLYLSNLESTNYKLEDLFHTSNIVFADWFTGNLSFGIGEYQYGFRAQFLYENYVNLSIEKGNVIKREIIRSFHDDPQFTIGKYKGKTFSEVLNGKISENTYLAINEYFEGLFGFITKKDLGHNIVTPCFNVTDEDQNIVDEVKESGIMYFLTPTYIAFSEKTFHNPSPSNERANRISLFVEKILTSDFKYTFVIGNEGANISNKTLLLNPDIKYLCRALSKSKLYCVPPHLLKKTYELKRIREFEIKRLNAHIFEYNPILEKFKHTFSNAVYQKNLQKFEQQNHVKYHTNEDYYSHNLTEEDFQFRFGHFLDEEYVPQTSFDDIEDDYDYSDYQDEWEEEELESGDWEYDHENPGHDPSENPYIDLFGPGDEANDAYWNTE